MKHHAQRSRFPPQLKCAGADSRAGDVLKQLLRRNVIDRRIVQNRIQSVENRNCCSGKNYACDGPRIEAFLFHRAAKLPKYRV